MNIIIKLLILIVRLFIRHQVKNQPGPDTSVDPALFVRQAKSGAEYSKIAADAMIEDGKNYNEVKALLLSKGLHEDYLDLYAKKAQQQYDKWQAENGDKPRLTAAELYEKMHKQALEVDPAIKLTKAPEEDHAYHFSALIGKERYHNSDGRHILYLMTAAALNSAPVKENNDAAVKQLSFQKFGGNAGNPYLRVITIKGQREAVFPYLQTDTEISFQTKNIIEWDIDDPVEAEIEGIGDGQFSLGFFSTDYAVNKHIYKLKQDIKVRLSAFILAISVSETYKGHNDANGNSNGYWPDARWGKYSYFKFEALVLNVTPAHVDKRSIGGILTLKLIDNKRGNDLVIDAYIHVGNITSQKIRTDMKVNGALWFQAELAD
ncbi:hypothetical protein [Mucilaginibacter sp.]|jgi:hypothetical protein|uniref:hypothetical protein n=1 Tax=Mucilaginibacter sp. TaxID=1882438 RepID=UPI002CFBC827|nr:hypothetical protein [Mucilaginibacter sp.]HTI59690.1 hypothetical protein [Mucilaginibacter sp.]